MYPVIVAETMKTREPRQKAGVRLPRRLVWDVGFPNFGYHSRVPRLRVIVCWGLC